MSRKYAAVPPPGFAQISNVASRTLSNDGFAMPLPPSQNKLLASAAASQPTRKRKSRFSDAPPSAAAPPPPTMLTELPVKTAKMGSIEDSSQSQNDKSALISAAAAAAAKINASLKAQGKIKDTANNSQLTSQSTASSSGSSTFNPVEGAEIRRLDDMYSTEIEINDIPIGCRNYLTRLSTQESINKSCLAYVSTRGKFMTVEDKKLNTVMSASDKPLYLFIQSQTESNVKKALDRIRQIINNHFEKKSIYQSQALAQIASLSQRGQSTRASVPSTIAQAFKPGYPLIPTNPSTPMPPCQPALPSGNFVQEKLFIGLDALPDHFDLKNKLLGPSYRNFNFISNQTGARVILRGKGSGFLEPTSGREAFESMYAFICHPSQSGVDAAKRLVQNLIDTIKREIPPNMLGMTSPVASNGNNYGFSGDYRNMGPPPQVMPPPPVYGQPSPSEQSRMIAYPFQQCNQELQSNGASSKQSSYGTSYHNFQHDFSDTTKSTTPLTTSTDKPRKRFTEDTDIPPPPLPPELEDKEKTMAEAEPRKTGSSLPFWMAP